MSCRAVKHRSPVVVASHRMPRPQRDLEAESIRHAPASARGGAPCFDRPLVVVRADERTKFGNAWAIGIVDEPWPQPTSRDEGTQRFSLSTTPSSAGSHSAVQVRVVSGTEEALASHRGPVIARARASRSPSPLAGPPRGSSGRVKAPKPTDDLKEPRQVGGGCRRSVSATVCSGGSA